MSNILDQMNLKRSCFKCGFKKCGCKNKQNKRDVLLGLLTVAAVGGAAYYINQKRKEKPLPVADDVDIERYMGTWYEIARLPQRYEKGTKNNAAHYSLNEKGHVDVVNTAVECEDGTNKDVSVKGKAFIVDPETNAKLKVSFFPPLCSKYWIIAVDDDYQWALVGHPDRESFWILSRTRSLDKKLLSSLLGIAHDLDFDIENLFFTRHDNVVKEKSNREKVAEQQVKEKQEATEAPKETTKNENAPANDAPSVPKENSATTSKDNTTKPVAPKENKGHHPRKNK